MASGGGVPPSLKAYQPYIVLAKQYETKKDIVTSYYLYMHVAQGAINEAKGDPAAKQYLLQLMDKMEKMKKSAEDKEVYTSEIVGQSYLEDVALKIFIVADNEDRRGMFNKDLVKRFYTSTLLIGALRQFGELSDELSDKLKYAKWKAADINRCLKNNIQPTPGPPGGSEEEFGSAGGGLPIGFSNISGDPQDQPPMHPTQHPFGGQPTPFMPTVHQPEPSYPPTGLDTGYPSVHPPSGENPSLRPVPKPRHIAEQPTPAVQPPPQAQPTYAPTSSGGPPPKLTFKEFNRASKLSRQAASALDYEDVSTAITSLTKALKLLQTGKED